MKISSEEGPVEVEGICRLIGLEVLVEEVEVSGQFDRQKMREVGLVPREEGVEYVWMNQCSMEVVAEGESHY